MLYFLISEAEIETIPEEIRKSKAIKAFARSRRKPPEDILLDSGIHFRAMQKLKDGERRGRPDITFLTLLNLLESPLNKIGKLKVAVHTRNDYIINISPEVRLPRAYHRFKGLLESLFRKRIIFAEGKVLLSLHRGTPRDFYRVVKPDFSLLLTSRGKLENPWGASKKLSSRRRALVIAGGFPRGDFKKDYSFVNERVSIFDGRLTAWAAANEIASNYYRHIKSG